MLIGSGSPVAAMKAKMWKCVYRVELPERNKRTFGNDDRQEWSMEFDRNSLWERSVFANTHSYSPTYIRDTNRMRHLVYSFQL